MQPDVPISAAASKCSAAPNEILHQRFLNWHHFQLYTTLIPASSHMGLSEEMIPPEIPCFLVLSQSEEPKTLSSGTAVGMVAA